MLESVDLSQVTSESGMAWEEQILSLEEELAWMKKKLSSLSQ